MKRSNDPLRRQAGLILEAFASERRTEGAFYLGFCAPAPMQIEARAPLEVGSGRRLAPVPKDLSVLRAVKGNAL